MTNRLLRNALMIQLLLTCMVITAGAQQTQGLIGAHFQQEREKNKWLPSDIQDWVISDQYTDPASGLTHAYVQQKLHNVNVFNAISVFLLKGNDVLHFKPGLISHIQEKSNSPIPSITAGRAVVNTLSKLNLISRNTIDMTVRKAASEKQFFDLSDIASSPVSVQLVYREINNVFRLAWDVSIELSSQPHWWNVRIDAATGEFIDQNDFTAQCYFGDAHLHENNEFSTEAGPSPSPDPATPSSAIPGYRVFPFPVEAPSFGSRSLLTDPSSPIASPFAWHDTDGITGEEYSITRGNNVYAYEDADNNNLPGYSASGGSSLLFDFPFANGASPLSNQDASLTNLFYTNNAIHDYLYSFGFTEAAGNFQTNNYGNGGSGNDGVKAEGLDGAGMNNANFSTPGDGSPGRMQMYLWNGSPAPCTNLSISSNSFNGSMTVGTATFSPQASVTANVILANDGSGTLTDACSPLINNVAGKIVLVDRGGTCSYIAKAQEAQTAGAAGVIIANNVSGAVLNMGGTPALTIPCVSISLADGNTLKAALLSGMVNASINTCTVYPVDGSFDNGIVAHEYGHGLSNRLTGGPSQSSCLSNAEQGGEGWSDWLALMMTIEPGDLGPNPRGIGTFALNQATTGGGIRRYPYSTNMSINPQTYATLASSTGAHQTGEIWCDVLWDMSWKLINIYGYSSNPNVLTAGNNIAMRLVIEGMKLQPCNPGFLDARDAIMTAEALIYGNIHRCLLWEAFAGRGMGFNASQGSAFAIADETAGFQMPPFCMPATQLPDAAFISDSTSIGCGGTVHFTDQSVQAFNWSWNFGDMTTSILQDPSHTFSSPGIYLVKLVVNNPLGSDSVTHVITVTPTFTAIVSTTPGSICGGDPVTLIAVASGSSNKSYQVSNISYAPVSGTGTVLTLNDDQMSSSKPIGFTFNFYGQNYTNFYICSNGFITFSPSMPANVVYGESIPSSAAPNNLIALAWNDLNPSVGGSSVSYFTTGTAPNRKLVVKYSTTHYLSGTLPFVVQAILYEGTNLIEIHTTTISDVSAFDIDATTTQGVENATGSSGVAVPGRNATLFAASNDAYRFTPYIPYSYTWLPGNLNGATQIVNPLSTTTYSVEVTDGTVCVSTFVAPAVTVNPCPVTMNLKAFIQGYYNGGSMMQPVLFNEGVSLNQSICDSIQIELHSAVPPYSLVSSSIAILQTNGTATLSFTVIPGSYYIVFKHRNGLVTWSANPVMFNTVLVNYDFSTSSNKAFGGNMKLVEPGVWAIFSGDIVKDENIDLLDHVMVENDIEIFASGYISTDINGDGNVDLLDSPSFEENINNFIFASYP